MIEQLRDPPELTSSPLAQAVTALPPLSPPAGWQQRVSRRMAPRPRRVPARLALVASAAVLTVLAIRAIPPAVEGDGARVAVRGETGSGEPLDPSVEVVRVLEGGRLQPAHVSVRAGEALLFAYSNPGSRFSHLMVFAVDDRRHTYWFYPAVEENTPHPVAVPIERARAGVELNEEIRHTLPIGRVTVFALFLQAPLSVAEVEESVARWPSFPGTTLTWPVAPDQMFQQTWTWVVEP